MRTRIRSLTSLAALFTTMMVAAQDADHLTTNGAGQSFLAPDALVPGGLGVLPVNLTVGTTPAVGATLRVRGDETELWMPDLDPLQPGMRCTYRTDVTATNNQNWSMVRVHLLR